MLSLATNKKNINLVYENFPKKVKILSNAMVGSQLKSIKLSQIIPQEEKVTMDFKDKSTKEIKNDFTNLSENQELESHNNLQSSYLIRNLRKIVNFFSKLPKNRFIYEIITKCNIPFNFIKYGKVKYLSEEERRENTITVQLIEEDIFSKEEVISFRKKLANTFSEELNCIYPEKFLDVFLEEWQKICPQTLKDIFSQNFKYTFLTELKKICPTTLVDTCNSKLQNALLDELLQDILLKKLRNLYLKELKKAKEEIMTEKLQNTRSIKGKIVELEEKKRIKNPESEEEIRKIKEEIRNQIKANQSFSSKLKSLNVTDQCYKLHKGGKIYNTENRWFIPKMLRGADYAISLDGKLITLPTRNRFWDLFGFFQCHSSILSGNAGLCFGFVHVIDGKIIHIDNISGHYKPDSENLYNAIQKSGLKKVLHDNATVSYIELKGKQSIKTTMTFKEFEEKMTKKDTNNVEHYKNNFRKIREENKKYAERLVEIKDEFLNNLREKSTEDIPAKHLSYVQKLLQELESRNQSSASQLTP